MSDSKDVELIFDFASPNAYMAGRVLPKMLEGTSARLRLNPCLLGGIFKATGNQAPIYAFAEVKGKLAYEQLEMRRFVARHGLTRFAMNPHFPVNSLLLMRGMVAVQADAPETLDTYVEAGLAAMWEEGLLMSDPDVFRARMDAAGLDGAAILARTQDADVKAKLAENTAAAVARGVFGIPTVFVGDEMFYGKERLGQVVEAASASAA